MSGASESDRLARLEIVAAARGLVAESGWHAASSARVAAVAGVSKALVHYHFRTKGALLVAVAESCQHGIVARTVADSDAASRHANPIDDFSDWLVEELESADLRIALQLTMATDDDVQHAAGVAREAYRSAVMHVVLRTFATLGLTSRISEALVVDVIVTVSEGMAIGGGASRRMIDALWLGFLTLAD